MSFEQFGEIIEYAPKNKPQFEEFGEIIESTTSKQPSVAKDVAKQSLLGGAKGLFGSYGSLLDLARLQAKEQLPGEKVKRSEEEQVLERLQQPGAKPSYADILSLSDDEIIPRYSRLPASQDIEQLAQMLGIQTEPETKAGRFASRAGEAIGSGASFGAGPGALAAFGLGGLAGQAVEEATDSPLAGALTELGVSLSPAALSKKLAPLGQKSKRIVEAGRKAGLQEKEISPLITEGIKKTLARKLGSKGSKVQKRLGQIENKLGDSYQFIREEASNLPRLNLEENKKLLTDFGKINKNLKTTIKAAPEREAASKFVESAMENIRNKGATPEELIGFWHDINNAVNWNAVSGGKKSLAALKQPILEALKKSSPRLAKDFEDTNLLYSRFKNISKSLKPSTVDDWIAKGEIGGLLLGMATLNPVKIKLALGSMATRKLARELAINPRLQTISGKMLNAIKNNKIKSANQLLRQSKKILEKEHPEEDWSKLEEEVS